MVRIFLICPVRNATPKIQRALAAYVLQLEEEGYQVHYPPWDTDQSDSRGTQICLENCDAMIQAEEVHIWFDPKSQGGIFDAGMLFAMLRILGGKRVVLVNRETVRELPHKDFQNVYVDLTQGLVTPP